jgi:glyceraldehyde 3-phosphate dehydrogenase
MKTKIAINGFGRIGRNAFKIAFERPDLEVVAVNDLTDTKTLAHLLKHDSSYGTYQHEVGSDDQNVIVNGQPIKVLAEKDPAALPWKDLGVDVVIESTGLFVDPAKARAHIDAGAKKVIISAPAKGDGADTIVIGVNDDKLKDTGDVISNASCTTNCITPVAAIIESNFGIEKALMTTVHSYTASQRLQDAPAKDLREARAAAENIVPTTTGASIAAAKAMPALEGIFGGLSVRVPTPVVSLSDFAIVTKRAVTKEEVNEAFKKAAKEPYYQGILDVTEEELVSTDFIGNSHSAIVDLSLTNVVGGNLLKVVAWYDNEWGYSNRLVEITADTGKLLQEGNVKMMPNTTPPADDSAQPAYEKELPAPTTDDFLPSPEPHNSAEEHSSPEAAPGSTGPGMTLPEHDVPTPRVLPDSESPSSPDDKPHVI